MKLAKKSRSKLAIICFLLAGTILISWGFVRETDRFEIVKNLDIFSSLFKEVNSLYVEEMQPGQLVKEGIDGMLESLDPYTVYYPESEIEDYKMLTTGQYGGIGARIRTVDKEQIIYEIFEDSPAAKAGLQVGDEIYGVEDKILTNESSYDLSKLLKGSPGTEVTLRVKRAVSKKEELVKVKREEITISSIPYFAKLNEEVGYIKVSSFTRNVSEEFKTAFLDLKNNQNCKKLIIDLRDNPGGLLLESISMVNFFIDKGETVVETKGKVEEWNKVYKTINKPLDTAIPIIVLVDGKSASASEIVSGSLQDMDRAIVMGDNTYGKGLVQTTVNLPYNSSMKVTTAKYYIPSGRCIQEIDYAKKDKLGHGTKTPDSIAHTFKTKNGREVKDGHGISPDIYVHPEKESEAMSALKKEQHIFNFSNVYWSKNPKIEDLKKQIVSEQSVNEFIEYLKRQNAVFTLPIEERFASLIEEAEKSYQDSLVVGKLKQVKEEFTVNKLSLLLKEKSKLQYELELELSKRYFYQKGKIQKQLDNELIIKKAIELLMNESAYKRYLRNEN